MALDTLVTPTPQGTHNVEPSRAWILGLVVESDGSVSGPGSDESVEWPTSDEAVTAIADVPEPAGA